MPPQLPSALRSLTYRTQTRLFTTSRTALAPREAHHQSTTSRLANLSRTTSAPRGDAAAAQPSQHRGIDAATHLSRYREASREGTARRNARQEAAAQMEKSKQFLRQMPRRWQAGDVYAPNDLGPVEMKKWKRKSPRDGDVVDALNLRPVDMYKNFSLIKAFTTTAGQIQHSRLTKLRPVNQRRIAKMIRRAQGMGLYPTIHAHPEMMREEFYGGMMQMQRRMY